MSGANNKVPQNKVLVKMLDRLFAAMVNGPGLNARPHNSRQRVDWSLLARLDDIAPDDALRRLLGEDGAVKLSAHVPAPKRRSGTNGRRRQGGATQDAASGSQNLENGGPAQPASDDPEAAAERAFLEQQSLLTKLRVIAEDARTYEQDTGVHVLNVGFPLLSLPPGSLDSRTPGSTRRVLAPVAFVPVAVTLSGGATQNVKIECRGDGIDRVTPNNALLAWIEQQTGKPAAPDLFADQDGEDPWREVCELVSHVCKSLDLKVPDTFNLAPKAASGATPSPLPVVPRLVPEARPATVKELTADEIAAELKAQEEAKDGVQAGDESSAGPRPGRGGLPAEAVQAGDDAPAPVAKSPGVPPEGLALLTLRPAPRAEDPAEDKPRIVPAAILGLFPVSNQGLLRDMQAMVGGEALSGPVESFISVTSSLFAEEDDKAKAKGKGEGDGEKSPADAPPPQVSGLHEREPVVPRVRAFEEERLVTTADPFQSRAVKLARESRGLVVHGPPGTGKSQTITNIIGDHLSRGQRVLLVCDKRTALDVVANRLEHMGLGRLCALIHDPQRDQRELYRDVREQLEGLPDAKTHEKAEARLSKLDAELQQLHAELSEYRDALMKPDAKHGVSLHELMGQWLALAPLELIGATPSPLAGEGRGEGEAQGVEPRHSANPPSTLTAHPDPLPQGEREKSTNDLTLAEGTLDTADLREVETSAGAVRDVLHRAREADFDRNPWTKCAGIPLKDFLARPMDQVRAAMNACVTAAREADGTADPAVPPFPEGADLMLHAEARANLATQLETVLKDVPAPILSRWASAVPEGGSAQELRDARQKINEVKPFVETFKSGPMDAELALIVRSPGKMPDHAALAAQAGALAQYLQAEEQWWSFFAFRQKREATKVLARYGLPLNEKNARRVGAFLNALQSRLVLRDLVAELNGSAVAANTPSGAPIPLIDDAGIARAIAEHTAALDLLLNVHDDYPLQPLAAQVSKVLDEPATAPPFLAALRKSTARAAALSKLETALAEAHLFERQWLGAVERKLRGGQTASGYFASLHARLDTLEGVLRVRQGLADLPKFIKPAAEQLLHQGADADDGVNLLRREMLSTEITRRLRAAPHLQSTDGQRLRQSFDRYRDLDAQRKDLTRDAVLHQWTSRQKERLLAGTGTRLNSLGAEMKRRLTSRGERAMRLRQVVAVGKGTDGGDPLFDLRPVWMASPETVAQVFPREPIFDVVVFDEASQCRLEEALPVLVRGKRVTIAGDPKQLPPTRFFESAVTLSDDETAEIETDQQLFEVQQAETEDLLGAALGLDIQQCYLDVHYRSRHADLIAFSNEHFYGSRLQPIPGHPANVPSTAPVTLYPVGGTYERRENELEAEAVVGIVKELLNRKGSPSVGIACFNLQQRDLIVEKLDEAAAQDASFAKKLAEARVRKGAGSFEGLFVKNLENVQGDERDHIIISTTYGPDARGKFYRRFGPLGRAGGGRRLNVLVTRAREQVHLVTSIPPEAYRGLPPVPPGQTPGGGWLLFAYLKFAEDLERQYRGESGPVDPITDALTAGADASTAGPQPVQVRPSKEPSPFAQALARKLNEAHGFGGDVHWGNEGFCVDLALRHPDGSGDFAAGLLCDAARFGGSEDPLEWDVFRTGVLEKQGWRLHRVWSPHFFRDPKGAVKAILREMWDAAPQSPSRTRESAPVAKPAARL